MITRTALIAFLATGCVGIDGLAHLAGRSGRISEEESAVRTGASTALECAATKIKVQELNGWWPGWSAWPEGQRPPDTMVTALEGWWAAGCGDEAVCDSFRGTYRCTSRRQMAKLLSCAESDVTFEDYEGFQVTGCGGTARCSVSGDNWLCRDLRDP